MIIACILADEGLCGPPLQPLKFMLLLVTFEYTVHILNIAIWPDYYNMPCHVHVHRALLCQ